MRIFTLLRGLLLVGSAGIGAVLCILACRSGVELPMVSASALFSSAPMAGVALAFPAVYLLWEQSEL